MSNNKSTRIGQYIKCGQGTEEPYTAYFPTSLPPVPPIEMENLYALLEQANTALGRLDSISVVLPDPSLFLYMYIRKEAVLSSQIEGTQSSLSDLLLFESEQAAGVPIDDVTEVSCYVTAMNYGLQRLQELPLSLRLLREIHAKLMSNARGGRKDPGEFRRSQNWIGGTRPGNAQFVPPPPDRLMESLDAFEKFLHDKSIKLPILIKAALSHVQFETIHPFLDGNGRLGRLLITFMLCAEGVLKQPLLYLSLYLKTHRQAYYDHLQSVRATGDWEGWIEFFLEGIIHTATQAVTTAKSILDLFERDRVRIETSGQSTTTVLGIFNHLQYHPIVNTTMLRQVTGKALPTVLRALAVLQKLGIVKEISGRARNRVFMYAEYIDVLNDGVEKAND
ncbi:MAG: Fic family protein [Alphaproteobacteria bacterium]|nr:MAG: Fic family protein [Alphaproteobacteria bacterium]